MASDWLADGSTKDGTDVVYLLLGKVFCGSGEQRKKGINGLVYDGILTMADSSGEDIFYHGNLRGPPQGHPPQEIRPY